jgi:2-C-methyl-D-erythritol 4-phosphate cytidylyltransferase
MDRTPDRGAAVLLLAAGEGQRLGHDTPKGFVLLAGRPLFQHSLGSILASGIAAGLVVVVPRGHVPRARELAEAAPGVELLGVVAGGVTRQESVRRGLEAVPAGFGAVLCHDAARPFASPGLFARVYGALESADGAVPVIGVADTVKRIRAGLVVETVPRVEIGLAQTPQAFDIEVLRRAHERAEYRDLEATDDAMLLEAAGYRVAAVPGEPANFKVTTEADLARAERVLAERSRQEPVVEARG